MMQDKQQDNRSKGQMAGARNASSGQQGHGGQASATANKEKMNLEDIVHVANKVGMEYAKAKKHAEHLELLKATKRAKAMLKHDDGKISEAKIKRLAETDEEYVEFIIELAEAKSEAEKLKIRYDSYKNLFEARRSMLSYQKAEMKLL